MRELHGQFLFTRAAGLGLQSDAELDLRIRGCKAKPRNFYKRAISVLYKRRAGQKRRQFDGQVNATPSGRI